MSTWLFRALGFGPAQPTTIVDLSLGPEHWEIQREGAIPTHEIVVPQRV